jgi:hypothetical protein
MIVFWIREMSGSTIVISDKICVGGVEREWCILCRACISC